MDFSWIIFCMLSLLFSACVGERINASSIDAILAERAFKTLAEMAIIRPRTGVLYKVPLPECLAGIEVSVIRVRTGSFWIRGSMHNGIHIPPGVLSIPYANRHALVYQNLANWSFLYHNVPGYSLVAPVVGFLAYEATNLSTSTIAKLDLRATKDPILLNFSMVAMPHGSMSTAKCVWFDKHGSPHLSNMVSPNVCSSENQGHFSLITPLWNPSRPASSPTRFRQKESKRWEVGVVCGLVGLTLLGSIGLMFIARFVKRQRNLRMEKQAEQREALGSVWIGENKMPLAVAARTEPTIENTYLP